MKYLLLVSALFLCSCSEKKSVTYSGSVTLKRINNQLTVNVRFPYVESGGSFEISSKADLQLTVDYLEAMLKDLRGIQDQLKSTEPLKEEKPSNK